MLPAQIRELIGQPASSHSLLPSQPLVKVATKLAVAGPTQQEAGPFHDDPGRIKELQLRAVWWGMTAVENGELGSGEMTSWSVAHGDL